MPFDNLESDREVIVALGAGKKPQQPKGMIDQVWELVEECCSPAPDERPSTKQIRKELGKLDLQLWEEGDEGGINPVANWRFSKFTIPVVLVVCAFLAILAKPS